MFTYQIINESEKATVFFNGDMDIETTEIMEEQLYPSLKECRKVEIDFTNISFIDSTGIGLLINLVQQLQEKNAFVTITQLSSQVYEVFNLLQISEILGQEVFPT